MTTLKNNRPIIQANNIVNLPAIIGKGYGAFWRFKGRYRVVKGSRASKKSKTTALWIISSMMLYPQANTLIIRKVYRTLKDSCFTELKWAINRLGVSEFWAIKESPLEMTYTPTGQKIYFRGLDDALKITSIAVETGVLCWAWIEEAYEITDAAAFDMLNESIRGQTPPGLFKQITLTFNPWNEGHWLKARFFDTPNADTLAITTNYLCNEYLDKADFAVFEHMRQTNYARYKVAGLGEWGQVTGTIYTKWQEHAFNIDELRKGPNIKAVFGLDFGYVNDETALFCGLIDVKNKLLYIFDEIYKKGLSNEDIAAEIIAAGYAKERITADAAEPKSIARLQTLGLRGVHAARKGKDSILHGIDFLQEFDMIIHPRCVNFLTEIQNYTWATDNKTGKTINKPIDEFNHLLDAMRYAVESLSTPTKPRASRTNY